MNRAGGEDLLERVAPRIHQLLGGKHLSTAQLAAGKICRKTVFVAMRDGIRLATDLYLPQNLPAPTVLVRTPYGRARQKLAPAIELFVRHGYVVAIQDCRGTGESEPDHWDYYVHEREDSYDFVEWVSHQAWQNGVLTSCGGSYVGQTQWAMALHPRMTAIAPEVSGLGITAAPAELHMFLNSYARSVGNGAQRGDVSYADLEREMLRETLEGGVFSAPLVQPIRSALIGVYPEIEDLDTDAAQARMWEIYVGLDGAGRAEFIRTALGAEKVSITEVEAMRAVFGQDIVHDAHSLPFPSRQALAAAIHAPPLMVTGWYDWGLNDALASWDLLQRFAHPRVAERARLLIAPSAHSGPGYLEGAAGHPELDRSYRTETIAPLLLEWFDTARADGVAEWPRVIYYLMGANEWRSASSWPPADTRPAHLYLGQYGRISIDHLNSDDGAVSYCYDPNDPTPTVGGSILSNVFRPGSADVSTVQMRDDVICFSSSQLQTDIDVVGPLIMTLFASTSAEDTDFVVRLSDVQPGGRTIQIQNGVLRARHRSKPPQRLEPGKIYPFEIDLWSTAHRFKAGHRIRIDVSSADFPRFNRHNNLASAGAPVSAQQTIYFGPNNPSHLAIQVRQDLSKTQAGLGVGRT